MSEQSWYPLAKQVVKTHQHIFIDKTTNEEAGDRDPAGTLLDPTTAHMLITIADNLSEDKSLEFKSRPILDAANIGWSLIRRVNRAK